MDITEEQLKFIEEYASNFMSYEEIAALININYKEFLKLIKNKESDVFKAYFRGKTATKLEIRKNIVKMAKHGNPQAEQSVEKYITDQEISERDATK